MRCQTRLSKSDLDEDTQTPLFLPCKSLLAMLYMQYLHNNNRHCSTTQTMTFYHQRVWTPKLRPLVSSIIRRCSVCQILRSSAASQPPPPVLPHERVRFQHPYACVGVDNTGSFPVRGTVEGRRYITIFVCTTSRHVHLEVTNSLSTEDFLHAFRRFASVYGTPAKILSDNGRNFVGASRCLAEAGKKEEFRQYMNDNNIDWHFQTPRAPWKGGHFERLIATVKTSLIVSLRNKKLNEEQFRTAVAEAQAVVNSRPLTYASNDLEDEPLTPAHLVRGTAVLTLPPIEIIDENDTCAQARNQHMLLTQALTSFRERWREEYLTTLLQRHEERRSTHSVKLRRNQLVLLHYPGSARYNWPLARVLEVFPDSEGIVRSVRLLCKGEEYLRPISQIVPLELDDEKPDSESESKPESPGPSEHETSGEPASEARDEESVQPVTPVSGPPILREAGRAARPVRRAAKLQREKMKALIQEGVV